MSCTDQTTTPTSSYPSPTVEPDLGPRVDTDPVRDGPRQVTAGLPASSLPPDCPRLNVSKGSSWAKGRLGRGPTGRSEPKTGGVKEVPGGGRRSRNQFHGVFGVGHLAFWKVGLSVT